MGEGASKLIIFPNSYICCRLKTGSMIIAIMDTIGVVVTILLVTVVLSLPDKTKNMGITDKLLYISLAAALLSFIGSGILLIGVVQERRPLFIPYFILSPIGIVLGLVVLGMSVPEVPVYVAVPLGMLTILGFYNWLIVLSYFGELGEFNDGDEGTGTGTGTDTDD